METLRQVFSLPLNRSSIRSLLGRFAVRFANSPTSFVVSLPDGSVQQFGSGIPLFHITAKNDRAINAIASLDEGRFGDAFVQGDIELNGEISDIVDCQRVRSDNSKFPLLVFPGNSFGLEDQVPLGSRIHQD